MPLSPSLGRLFGPLRSRKVGVAFGILLGAFAAEYGLKVSSELLRAIIGIGVSLVPGIAHEDGGRFAASFLKNRRPSEPGSEGRS